METSGLSSTPAADEVSIQVSSTPPNWSALESIADATIYSDPRWGGVMQQAYGNRPHYLTARQRGHAVGCLMLIEQRSLLFGSRLCSIPYFDSAGLATESASAGEALLAEAVALRDRCRVGCLELRQLRPLDTSIPTRTDKVTMHLDLPADGEAMWEQLNTKMRTKIRRAKKNDLELADGGEDLLAEFHRVYSRAMRDLGSPPHSRRFFELVAAAFPGETRLFVVRSGGAPIAASLTLRDRRGFRVPWSGSDARFRKLSANRLMFWAMLEHAAETGAPTFDFGRSTVDSGTYAFKKEWGAQPVQLVWHYLMPTGKEVPDLRPYSPKFRLFVRCWKKLPLFLAERLGPRIVGRLS